MKHFDLDSAGGYLIELSQQALKKKLKERFKENNIKISPLQWIVLYRLWQKDKQTQAELSMKAFKDYPTISTLLNGLEKGGLVRRKTSNKDRRYNIISLTEEGKKLRKVLPPIVEEHLASAFKGIPD